MVNFRVFDNGEITVRCLHTQEETHLQCDSGALMGRPPLCVGKLLGTVAMKTPYDGTAVGISCFCALPPTLKIGS